MLSIELFDYESNSKQEQKKKFAKEIAEKTDEATEFLNEVMAHIEDYKRLANENEIHN